MDLDGTGSSRYNRSELNDNSNMSSQQQQEDTAQDDEYTDEKQQSELLDYDDINRKSFGNGADKKKRKSTKAPGNPSYPSQGAAKSAITSSLRNPKRSNLSSKPSPHQSRFQNYQYDTQRSQDSVTLENENGDDDQDEQDEDQDEHLPLSQGQYGRATGGMPKSALSKNSKSNTLNSSNSLSNLNQNQQYRPSMTNHNGQPPTPFKHHPINQPKSHNINMSSHTIGYELSSKMGKLDLWGHLLIGISYFFLVFSFPFSLCACVKVAQEYERAVIFRLGRILEGGAKGPGIFFVLPCIDTYTKVDLRTVTFDVPPQEILTKDSVTVSVDAVVYFRIFNAVISVINVEDAAKSTKLLAASTLRNILGTKSLHEILSDRESVAILIQNNLDEATGPWGVKVERVEVKDVRLPVQLQRAMATEAEAAREARAKVIAAEGEQKASKALKEAAEVISESPIAIQLRYLQTLTQIASEKNSTIVFPIPLEMLSFLANKTASLFRIKT